jgi:hypothetical protein
LCGQLAPEGVRRHVVDERLGAADLDDRDQLSEPVFEGGIARDVHLAQLEGELGAQLLQRSPGALAQVALRRVIKDDVGRYG